jgi:Beta-propeller repeat
VNFSAAANSGLTRTGSITIAGQEVTVSQQGSVTNCVTNVNASSFQNLSAAGGAMNFAVSAPGGCSWSAVSPVSWIAITSGSSGSGNGNVGISVAPNSGRARNAQISIAGQIEFVGQNGICGFAQCSDGFVAKINTNASGASSLVYSTYLGGNNFDVATGVAIDGAGDAYVSGTTLSTDFPVANAFQTSPKGGRCGPPGSYACASAFVAELNSTGTTLLFSTYLGGSANNAATGVALDPSGNAYVTGFTNSTDFPVSSGVAQSSLASATCSFTTFSVACPDAFVTKFTSSGSMVYSTYLGGTGADLALSIAADSVGNAYVTGMTTSTNFPTVSPTQASLAGGPCSLRSKGVVFNFTCPNVFVSELNPAGATLLFSTYLGGSAGDIGTGIGLLPVSSSAVAHSTNPAKILVTGVTLSPGLAPAGVFQSTPGGKGDAFVAEIGFPAPSFSMSAGSNSSTSATVTAGQTATYNLQLTPANGFTGTVNLSCTGAPTKATCTPSISSVNVTDASAIPFSVSVSTTKNGLWPQSPVRDPHVLRWYLPLTLLAQLLIAIYVWDRAVRLRKLRFIYAFAGVLLACVVLSAYGCSSGGSGNTPPPSGTPPGSYTLSITGTSQTVSSALPLTLTVN